MRHREMKDILWIWNVVPAWNWEDRSTCKKLCYPDHVLAWASCWDFPSMEVFSLCPWQANTENGKMPRRFLPGAGTVFFQSLIGWMLLQGWRTVVIVLREIVTMTTVGNRKRKTELEMGPCRKLGFQDRLEPVIKAAWGNFKFYPEKATLKPKRNGVLLEVLAEGAHSQK